MFLFNSQILTKSLNIWTVNIKNVCLYDYINLERKLYRIEDNYNNNQNIAIVFYSTFCISSKFADFIEKCSDTKQ